LPSWPSACRRTIGRRTCSAAGLAKATDVIVRQPDYVAAIDTIVKSTPAATWRDYLTAKLTRRIGRRTAGRIRAGQVRLPRAHALGAAGNGAALEARA
jgi:hypothetical protein